MDSSGYLLLQQSEFLSNYVGSFQELRAAGELFDVTLACEDETLEAHKVVISACSPFFRHILTKMKQTHPFIYLKGVLYKDLVGLLDYVYTGETQILAEDVDRFIEAAKELKIKGLIEENIEISDNDSSPLITKKKHAQIKEVMEMNPLAYTGDESSLDCSSGSEEATVEHFNQFDSISETVEQNGKVLGSHSCKICNQKYKTEQSLGSHINQAHREIEVKKEAKDETDNALNDFDLKVTNFESEDENEQNEKLRTEIFNRTEIVQDPKYGRMWRCTECGKMLKKKNKIELHVETHLEGFSHKCNFCDTTRKTRGSLKTHISMSHREEK